MPKYDPKLSGLGGDKTVGCFRKGSFSSHQEHRNGLFGSLFQRLFETVGFRESRGKEGRGLKNLLNLILINGFKVLRV